MLTKWVKLWPRYVDFSIFQDGGRRHLGFLKFKTVGRLKSAELRRRTKFGRNRSNRGRNMAIFRFLKMAATAILDFSNFKFLTVAMPNLVEIGHTAAEIWPFFDFQDGGRRHLGF